MADEKADEKAPAAAPQILLLSGNLMGVSRVAGVVRGCGMTFQGSRSVDHAASLDLSELIVVLVDLDLPIDLEQLAARMPDTAQRIAFGPHVDTEKLAAAAASGWEVLSNGQFHSLLPELARRWAS